MGYARQEILVSLCLKPIDTHGQLRWTSSSFVQLFVLLRCIPALRCPTSQDLDQNPGNIAEASVKTGLQKCASLPRRVEVTQLLL